MLCRASGTDRRSHGLKPVTHGALDLLARTAAEFLARTTAPSFTCGRSLNPELCILFVDSCTASAALLSPPVEGIADQPGDLFHVLVAPP